MNSLYLTITSAAFLDLSVCEPGAESRAWLTMKQTQVYMHMCFFEGTVCIVAMLLLHRLMGNITVPCALNNAIEKGGICITPVHSQLLCIHWGF